MLVDLNKAATRSNATMHVHREFTMNECNIPFNCPTEAYLRSSNAYEDVLGMSNALLIGSTIIKPNLRFNIEADHLCVYKIDYRNYKEIDGKRVHKLIPFMYFDYRKSIPYILVKDNGRHIIYTNFGNLFTFHKGIDDDFFNHGNDADPKRMRRKILTILRVLNKMMEIMTFDHFYHYVLNTDNMDIFQKSEGNGIYLCNNPIEHIGETEDMYFSLSRRFHIGQVSVTLSKFNYKVVKSEETGCINFQAVKSFRFMLADQMTSSRNHKHAHEILAFNHHHNTKIKPNEQN